VSKSVIIKGWRLLANRSGQIKEDELVDFKDLCWRYRHIAQRLFFCALLSFHLSGAHAETIRLDAACFGVQSSQQVQSKACQTQQSLVVEAAIIAEENGEVTLSDIGFGVFEFDFQGQRVACLRSGVEMKCLPVEGNVDKDT
jgi:hypothetical protein